MPRWLCVASGTSSRIRSTSPSAKPGLEQALGRSVADEALRARAGVDAPRLDADDAPHALGRGGGDADQRRDLLRRQAGDRRLPLERVLRLDPHLGAQRVLPLDDVARDVLGERLDEERLADHDLVDRLAEQLREARHVDALLAGSRSTVQEISAANVFSWPSCRIRIAFWTPVTPARVSPSWMSGTDACRSPVRLSRISAMGYNRSAPMPDRSVPRLVSLACHDLRTPLATVYGFARTLTRTGELDERSARFVGMIEEAAEQMTELLDELGRPRASRAAAGSRCPGEVDTLELAARGRRRIVVEGDGEPIETDADAVARCAAVAGGRGDPPRAASSRLTWQRRGRQLALSPVTADAAPVVTAGRAARPRVRSSRGS